MSIFQRIKVKRLDRSLKRIKEALKILLGLLAYTNLGEVTSEKLIIMDYSLIKAVRLKTAKWTRENIVLHCLFLL